MFLLNKEIEEIKKNWNLLGSKDPMWAISSLEGKKGKKWEEIEFYTRGKTEIKEIMKIVDKLYPNLKRSRALDYGCGIGRCTLALAEYFDNVEGLDIARSMINTAIQKNNSFDNISYHTLDECKMSSYENGVFDFIYCTDVIQHINPTITFNLLKDFLRVLSQNGILIVQIPSEFDNKLNNILYLFNLKNKLSRLYGKIFKKPVMEYHLININIVKKEIQNDNAQILEILSDKRKGVKSYRYFITKLT
jgi:ubiquinone/menaquinone biosynthesis C-methylase UbiE